MTQGSLTISLGYPDPDELPVTLATIMTNIIHGGKGWEEHMDWRDALKKTIGSQMRKIS